MKKKVVMILILALFLGLIPVNAQEIWHVEPPMWWTEMKNPELQIMIHGEQVSDYQPSIDYPGVILQRTVRVENPNYLFLYLILLPEVEAGEVEIILKSRDAGKAGKAGRIVIPYKLLEREANSACRKGFDASDVLYLITPDRFANGDPGNDTVEGMEDGLNRKHPFGRHGGDLKGIIDQLDYIADMGFTALWLNPVVENDMPRSSYHGYAATDFYQIDARYGSNDDYRALSQKAKGKGIKLIMDQIMNHCGSAHWWMNDLPSKDWIHGLDEYKQTSHKRVVLHDPYVAAVDVDKFTEGWFVPTMPDMNQDHPLLADYLVQNSIWWVEFADLDGIRHDTHPYAGKEFMAEYSCRIMNEYPNFSIVGEEWSTNPNVIAKWQRGKVNPDQYISCMPQMFDFPLQVALKEALIEDESWGTGWIKVYEMLANDFVYADPMNLVTFTDNHDMDRIFTQLGEDYKLFKMAMVYNLTMRGIPQIYYGTELLMTNAQPGNHGLIRADFPGGWDGDEINAFEAENMPREMAEAQDFMKGLLNWRKSCKAIHEGRTMHYAPENGLYVYFRYLEDQVIMIALNKSEKKVKLDPKNYPEQLSDRTRGFNPLTQEQLRLDNCEVGESGFLIIEINY